jgi:pimeloyl-ACP methyl ester carboxylesterase
MSSELYVETVGTGAPVLLLLHGLGVNGAVWQKFLRRLDDWPGRIVIPDLRGHGRSPHAAEYSDRTHAADVAALVADERDVYVVGHSMGGAVGLTLSEGSWPVGIKAVFAFAVKTGWRDDELAKLQEFARRPVRYFATEAEAIKRFLLASGLEGLVDRDAAVVKAGIVHDDEGYRLAADPRTVMVAGASLQRAFQRSKAERWLACGRRDPMVDIAQLRAVDASAIELGDNAHNVHVEDPDRLLNDVPFLADMLSGSRTG